MKIFEIFLYIILAAVILSLVLVLMAAMAYTGFMAYVHMVKI